MNRIDGMPTEFEWKIFPGITTLGLLEKIQSLMRDIQSEPEHFKDRIIFMSMLQQRRMERKKQRKMWIQFTDVCEMCSQIPSQSLVFLGAWIRKEMVRNLHWSWNQSAENMRWQLSQDPVIQYFVQYFWKRRIYEAKEGDKKSIQFNGSHENIECASPHNDFFESVEYLRSNSRHMQRITIRS